jgi:Zn-dependent protease
MQDQIVVLCVIWYVVFVFSTTLHEAGHALAAWLLGDPTAYAGGQVTIDPTPHIQREPIGMLVAPILSCIFYSGHWIIGWASCPYDPRWAINQPRRAALMALAGPVANLLLAAAGLACIKVGLASGFFERPDRITSFTAIVAGNAHGISAGLAVAVSILFSMNLILFVFNLIPLPPLDGSAVLMLFLPRDAANRVQEILWDRTYQMLGMVAAWVLAPRAISQVFVFVLSTFGI